MATKETLQQALAEPYSLPYFSQHVLQPIFSESVIVFASPIPMQVNPSEERMVKSIKKYGEVKLNDYRQVDLYEVALSDSVVVERSKVGIGAVVKKLIAGNNAVLINFYYPDQPNKSWRFSFIAKDQIIEEGEAKKVETNPKRYTYVLGPNERCRTAAERFNKLSLETDFTVSAFQEAFSVEKLSKKFFEEYKEHYDAFVKHLCKREIKASVFNGDEKAVRDFAKKLLGRIVFLYFVQKKGWLGASNENWQDGNPNFVEDLFIVSGRKETFYPLWLRTLFYDSLNNPDRSHNDFKLPNGTTVKVPYLNGGLFEDDDPKGSAQYLTFPPRLFEDLFEFFNQYNFTIYEDSPDDHIVAVDPEMLGHIFENLLEDNKDKGAYYTPKEIVHYMCHESIIEYLATKLDIPESVAYQELGADQTGMFGNEAKKGQLDILKEHKIQSLGITRDDVRQFITNKEVTPQIIEHAKEINALLDAVKICDPAIGSGAFPMGLLHEIFDAKQFLKEIAHVPDLQKVTNAEMKENIIQNSIYGVDIEKGAVDIARLRFWLSLIVDEELPRPLPNLDFKIVVGDSLLPKFEDKVVDVDWEVKAVTSSTEQLYSKMKTDLQELVAAQRKYFSAKKEKEKEKQKQAIRDLKIEILLNQLQLDKSKYEHHALATEELFESGKKVKDKRLENELRITGYDSAIKRLLHLQKHTNKPLKFFDWKLDFPEILNSAIAQREGFDIVIGNPPYVKEDTNKNAFDGLKSNECYQGKMDLWYLFGCKGLDLLKHHGIMCFIATNNWVSNDGASKFRNKVVAKGRLIDFIDFGNYKVFAAGIQTMVYVMAKDSDPPQYKLRYGKLLNDNADLGLVSDFLNLKTEVSTPNYERYIVGFNRQDFIDTYIKFIPPCVNKVVEKIKKAGTFLLSDNEVFSGIDVMQDSVNKASSEKLGGKFEVGAGIFVVSSKEKTGRSWNKRELEKIKPYYTTREINRYYANPQNQFWVLYTGAEINRSITDYPNIKKHLDQFKNIITSVNKPYGLHRTREEQIFLGEKILSVRKCSQPSFSYVDYPCYVARTFLIIKSVRINLKYLVGLLNSKLIELWLFEKGKLQGNLFQVDKVPLLSIPIKIVRQEEQNKIIKLVEKILQAKKDNTAADTSKLEHQINLMVYRLYGLTFEEAKVIDPELTKEDFAKYATP